MAAQQSYSFLEELAPYLNMIIPESGGTRVGALAYANTQDLVSTALIPVASGVIAANASVQFYNAALNEIGQGFTTGATLGQTNSQFSKGQAPKNQVYVATHIGFEVGACITGAADPALAGGVNEYLVSANQVFSLATNLSWDLTIGRGNVRTIGTLLDYPSNAGAWASVGDDPTASGYISAQNGLPGLPMKQLALPICFPPLVNVTFSANSGNSFACAPSTFTGFILVRAFLKGALMTNPMPQN